MPNIETIFHFGPHDTTHDVERFRPHLMTADIFVPEVPICPEPMKPVYSRLGGGDRSAFRELRPYLPGDFNLALLRAINDAAKQRPREIAILDVPHTREWLDKMSAIRKITAGTLFLQDPEDTIKLYRRNRQRHAVINEERDEIIATNIAEHEPCHSYSSSEDKGQRPRRLIVLGSAHQPILDKVSRKGIHATQTPDSSNDIMVISDEIVLGYRAGRRASEPLLMRGILGDFLLGMTEGTDSSLRIKNSRQPIDDLSDGQVIAFFEELAPTAGKSEKFNSKIRQLLA